MQRVREIRLDCDGDAIVLLVEQVGGIACHTGRERCFFRRLDDGAWHEVEPVLKDPEGDLRRWLTPAPTTCSRGSPRPSRRAAAPIPSSSYVAALFAKGDDAILKKIGEEATETVMAAKDGDARPHRAARWRTCGSTASCCWRATAWRRRTCWPSSSGAKGTSGHAEKAARGPARDSRHPA